MGKVIVSISIDEETLELFSQMRTTYHLKNNSRVIELIVRQWQNFMDDRKRALEKAKESPRVKPVNPMVDY